MNWPAVKPRGEVIAPGPKLAPGEALDVAGKARASLSPNKVQGFTYNPTSPMQAQAARDKTSRIQKASV